MYTKNLLFYNSRVNIGTIILRKISLIKILFLLLFLIIFVSGVIRLYSFFEDVNNGDILVADFKTDISMLSETAGVLEIERTSNKYSEINQFGSDGKLINSGEITPDLSEALINIIDIGNDGKISSEEIELLGMMRLKPDVIQKELKKFQFNLKSSDHNLKNFIIITKGKHAGTILYNGHLKFIDDENKRYFGLELSTNVR